MLSAEHRLRRSAEFGAVVRRGRRAGRPRVVVHLLVGPDVERPDVEHPDVERPDVERPDVEDTRRAAGTAGQEKAADAAEAPARCGFVVSKAVGSAAVRNTVKRRLRHLMREKMPLLPRGSLLVVRALPAAAGADSAALGADLDSALRRLLGRGGAR